MISTFLGLLAGIFKNLVWIAYSLIDALVFLYVFNYLAPYIVQWGLHLPIVHINYWVSLCLFLMIKFIGNWINLLTPKIIEIPSNSNLNSNSNSNSDSNKQN